MNLLPKVFTSKGKKEIFDHKKITKSLIRETGMEEKIAEQITLSAVRRIVSSNPQLLTAPQIREMVNCILIEKGYEEERTKTTRLGIPSIDVEKLVKIFLNLILLYKNRPFYNIEIVMERERQMKIVYKHLLKERYGLRKMRRFFRRKRGHKKNEL